MTAITDEELDAALCQEAAELDQEALALWAEFEIAISDAATDKAEALAKLDWVRWALVERGCPEEAARMLDSAIADLSRAQDD